MLLQNSVAVKNCAYSCNVWSAVVNVYLHYIHNKLWGVLTHRGNLTTFLAICIVLIDILNLTSVLLHPEIIM